MRAEGSRAAIQAAAAAASFVVCDINLRPPFIDAAVVADAARSADLLKLNDEELVPLASMLFETTGAGPSRQLAAAALAAALAAERAANVPNTAPMTDGEDGGGEATRAVARAAASIGAALGRASSVVVTRGARGAVLWQSTKSTSSGDEGGRKEVGGKIFAKKRVNMLLDTGAVKFLPTFSDTKLTVEWVVFQFHHYMISCRYRCHT